MEVVNTDSSTDVDESGLDSKNGPTGLLEISL